MTDADLLRELLLREQRWLQTLHELRTFHQSEMGKVTTAIQWMAGRELGRFSWLGYYWHNEMFWFGYGLHENIWRPLVEADNRSAYSRVWENLRDQLSVTWQPVPAEQNQYSRLWSSLDVGGNSAAEMQWFKARSRELHEYAVRSDG